MKLDVQHLKIVIDYMGWLWYNGYNNREELTQHD